MTHSLPFSTKIDEGLAHFKTGTETFTPAILIPINL